MENNQTQDRKEDTIPIRRGSLQDFVVTQQGKEIFPVDPLYSEDINVKISRKSGSMSNFREFEKSLNSLEAIMLRKAPEGTKAILNFDYQVVEHRDNSYSDFYLVGKGTAYW